MPDHELLQGVADPALSVAAFFDAFDWEGRELDAESSSAEAFLLALTD